MEPGRSDARRRDGGDTYKGRNDVFRTCRNISEILQIKDAKKLPAGSNPDNILEKLKDEIPQDYERFTDMDGVRVDYPDGWFLVRASGLNQK